jgi:hypothetical protein
MKQKINMVGGGFQHDVCSSALNQNKFVEWVKDGSANISIHIDNGLFYQVNPNKKNYGWLAESSAIIADVIEKICNNLNYFKQKYEFIFTHDRRIIEKDDQFFKFVVPNALPYIQNKSIYKKTKLVSFIGSNKTMCNGHNFRQQMIHKYNHIVDHYGRGFGNRELPWVYTFNNIEESGKLIGLKDYMFSFAMENDNYDDIFCEKITDCFATGTIPIYWGTKNIKNYFDINGILELNEGLDISMLTEELYLSKLNSIQNNFKLCNNMQTSEDYAYLNYIK